jgi:hypothetical protein
MLHMLHTKTDSGKLWSMGAGDRFGAVELPPASDKR